MDKVEILLVFVMLVALTRFLMWHWCAYGSWRMLCKARALAAHLPEKGDA